MEIIVYFENDFINTIEDCKKQHQKRIRFSDIGLSQLEINLSWPSQCHTQEIELRQLAASGQW